jgi:hypothetical protein
MRIRPQVILPLLLALGVAPSALSQRVVKTKDAPAPLPTTPEPPPPSPTATPTGAPQAAPGQPAPAATPKAAVPKPVPAVPKLGDAGPQFFKDDLTADDLKRSQGALPDQDCQHGGCEALLRRRIGLLAYVLHVRPSQPAPGQVAELVVDLAEVVEPPDPDIGDRRPMDNQQLVGTVQGMGAYQLHPAGGNAGAYGFHFTPQAKGIREVEIKVVGRSEPAAVFRVNIGGEQKVSGKGETLELRSWESGRGIDTLGRNMYDLGKVWGQLWLLSRNEGKGDLAALTKLYAGLGQQLSTMPLPRRADRTLFQELAGKLAGTGETVQVVKAAGLRDFMSNTQTQQCNRCHVVFDYHLTDDVAQWPSFTVGGEQ